MLHTISVVLKTLSILAKFNPYQQVYCRLLESILGARLEIWNFLLNSHD